jgi:hypothetical protein
MRAEVSAEQSQVVEKYPFKRLEPCGLPERSRSEIRKVYQVEIGLTHSRDTARALELVQSF